jgi:predicted RNase H-like HicB family nuclease
VKSAQRLTAIIEREDDGFISLCPEFDIASESTSIEEARANLIEALTEFFETARRPKSRDLSITKCS